MPDGHELIRVGHRLGNARSQADVWTTAIVKVDNPTPTIPSSARSVIHGPPWCGRTVAVYEVLVKQGQSVCRRGLEEERSRPPVEAPTWMLRRK